MIKVFQDTKVFVPCPSKIVSGGAELLHQLVDFLRNNGVEAYIYYTDDSNAVIASDYKCYNIVQSKKIEDNSHNILVLFEPEFYRAFEKTSIQKILWWLSVDNFFKCSDEHLSVIDIAKDSYLHAFRVFAKRIISFLAGRVSTNKIFSLSQLARLDVVSAYQSEYAQNFLLNSGFKEIVPLKDFINTEHCLEFTKNGRQDIVLYNPKKGFEFTKKLIKLSPDIKWIPIINMSRKQVIDAMKNAKVYIDFGNHPGKDRLPRECAMNGLCIITGRRGSARFFEDVWLENKYKFDERYANKLDIIKRIHECINDYNARIDDFEYYRNRIKKEKSEFEKQICDLFSIEY